MGLPLLLTLLLPLASLQAGHRAEPNPNTAFGMNQPKKLSALEGDSIHIPFFFYYPWELHKVPNVNIFWRWKHFHGKFIYNTTPMFIHNDFKDRLLLNWTKGGKNGSLQISKLRREDASSYFCRVEMDTQGNGKQMWQSIEGTTLTINPTTNTIQVPTTTKTTTQGPTTTITTTAGLRVPEGKRSSWSWPLSNEATVGLALASAALITAIVGLTVYLRWKRSKGLQTKARTPARGSFQNPEEKYENIGNKGQHTGPKLDTKTQTTQKPAGVEGHQGPERHTATRSSSLFNFLALDHKNKSPCTICLNVSKEKADITFNFCPSCHKGTIIDSSHPRSLP
ncbi:paired immunoglobulin-like type 2 receptor beta isoform X1 [Phocoena sinus]|uniref:paired immunoglobulin-like type 2 receptor beta isoform X1 n=1 Tax=Phocoena sinus TaxID=42100 RepID=UPI0013C4E70F|nr:paired immunoglobulin-like type 2 receptor beta isoform X1 [Phocoena sinus]